MKTAFFDLETTSFRADFGQLLCGVVGQFNPEDPERPHLTTFVLENYATPEGRCDDRELALDIRDFLQQQDLIISYNGTRFDIPFLNTRLTVTGGDYHLLVGPGGVRHKDLYYVVKNKFRLSSSSLKNAAKHILGSTVKTELDMNTWRRAHAGVADAYNDVVIHCEYDVIELARLWNAVKHLAGSLG